MQSIAVFVVTARKLPEVAKTLKAAIGITQTRRPGGRSTPVPSHAKYLQPAPALERKTRLTGATQFPCQHLRFWIRCFGSGPAGFG